jgi:isopentenyldiphosphate isomerase
MRRREPDPRDEMFEVLTDRGEPTGKVTSRFEVHREGYWHRSFHCWLVWRGDDGQPVILFQRRSHNKDTAGGLLDVAVGGHYRAGEEPDEVYREIEEELGIHVEPGELRFVGVRFATGVGPGYIDREVQDVHVHALRHEITAARPAYEEITALETVTLADLEALFSRDDASVTAIRYPVTPDDRLLASEPIRLTQSDFLPVSDNYWVAGARAAAAALEGATDPQLILE